MLNSLFNKYLSFPKQLSKREGRLLLIMAASLTAVAFYLAFDYASSSLLETERKLTLRTKTLENLATLLNRYKTLQTRLDNLKATFSKSQLSFEEVTKQIDKIVRDSIGSDSYDLKKGRSPTPIGNIYEKQEFTLNVPSINLEQAVKLLFQLEQGESPLFLGKVDVTKSTKDKSLSLAVEIFSIRKT